MFSPESQSIYQHPRRTKIIATIGPATESPEMLARMIQAGMNVARLNMSHASHEQASRHVATIRQVAKELRRTVGILMDTQGPAIRTGDLPVALNLTPGDIIALTVRGETSEEYRSVDVNYDQLVDDISVGDVVVVDNGNINLKVLEKHRNRLNCQVLTAGVLGSRRHINLPGVRVNLPALTEKDLADIKLGIELGVDFIAMSFVREAQDVLKLRGILDFHRAPQKIVAKLEDQQGIRNLDGIIAAADAIMIARGDLGIELPFEELPPLQRKIVKTCIQRGRPVIVATHMLESMIDSPAPTRAEVTDVANAIFEQADAIMLSGETSVGSYPTQCIQIMDRIARRIERSGGANFARLAEPDTEEAKLVRAASNVAREVGAAALVVFTRSGRMAQYAAWTRPLHCPVFACTDRPALLGQLALLWGCDPVFVDFAQDPNETVRSAANILLRDKNIPSGSRVLFVTEVTLRGKIVDTIQLETIG